MKRFIGVILFIAGLIGALYYLPPTIFKLDMTTGAKVLDFVTNIFPFLKENYEAMAFNSMLGLSSPLPMFLICVGFVVLGGWLSK